MGTQILVTLLWKYLRCYPYETVHVDNAYRHDQFWIIAVQVIQKKFLS